MHTHTHTHTRARTQSRTRTTYPPTAHAHARAHTHSTHTCAPCRASEGPRTRQKLKFDESDSSTHSSDTEPYIDADSDIQCGQESRRDRQHRRLQQNLSKRQQRHWRSLGFYSDVETVKELISTRPNRYDTSWIAQLWNENWIRRSPKDESLKPDSTGTKKVVFCCGSGRDGGSCVAHCGLVC